MASAELIQPSLAQDARCQAMAKLMERMQGIELAPMLVYLVDDVDASALLHLAEQFHVMGLEGWALAESDGAKRALIKHAIELHRYKGTPWAARQIIRVLGFGEVGLIENIGRLAYDGTKSYNGYYIHGDPAAWAVYRVIMERAITNDQAALLKDALGEYAAARCHLASLEYQAVPIRYNGAAVYGGQYNHGTAL